MSAPRAHPMMPASSHDELSEQMFVTALKGYVFGEIDPLVKDLLDNTMPELDQEEDRKEQILHCRIGATNSSFHRAVVCASCLYNRSGEIVETACCIEEARMLVLDLR